ncbi:MAG: hypothetical protein WD509_01825 [Candidatus Paceibacterota bacterium]
MEGKDKNNTVKNGDFEPYKEKAYEDFVLWFALPSSERARMGASTMAEFAERYGVHVNTLTRWKRAEGFDETVLKYRRSWGNDMTSHVFDGWKLACMKGNPQAIELWMAYFEGFNKTHVVQDRGPEVEVTEDDIRSLINELPIEKQKEYYGSLKLLHNEVRYYRRENERKRKEEAEAETETKNTGNRERVRDNDE